MPRGFLIHHLIQSHNRHENDPHLESQSESLTYPYSHRVIRPETNPRIEPDSESYSLSLSESVSYQRIDLKDHRRVH